MAEQSNETEHQHGIGNAMQTNDKIKAEMFELHSGTTQNEMEKPLAENALLDLTRSAIASCLDDFAGELPANKKDWLENIKKALNTQFLKKEYKKNSLDAKFALFRIEIAREVSRIDKANEAKYTSPDQQTTSNNSETTNTGTLSPPKKYMPINLSQVLLKRTLV